MVGAFEARPAQLTWCILTRESERRPVTRPFPTRPLQFYMTAPAPCPYLPGRSERKVFAHLDGDDGAALNDALSHAGFRRSQSIVYRPACTACTACISARIPVADFSASGSQRRIAARNADLTVLVRPPHATQEQFDLLSRYLEGRHSDGGMTGMSIGDYAMMVSDTPTRTTVVEYRTPDDRLVSAALVDQLADGYSLVYSFYDLAEERRSLGTHVILDHVARAKDADLEHVYLGYWVEGSAKMAYKTRFKPLEVLRRGGWRRWSSDDDGSPGETR